MDIRKGDRVIVAVPPVRKYNNENIRKFNGVSSIVTRVHVVMHRTNTTQTGVRTYELAGVTGKDNVPYTFLREWLVPEEEA